MSRRAPLAFVVLAAAVTGCAGADAAAPNSDSEAPLAACPSAPAWGAGRAYAPGALASAGGKGYRCVQAHTSQPGWEPPSVPALWQPLSCDATSAPPSPPPSPPPPSSPPPPPSSPPHETPPSS